MKATLLVQFFRLSTKHVRPYPFSLGPHPPIVDVRARQRGRDARRDLPPVLIVFNSVVIVHSTLILWRVARAYGFLDVTKLNRRAIFGARLCLYSLKDDRARIFLPQCGVVPEDGRNLIPFPRTRRADLHAFVAGFF